MPDGPGAARDAFQLIGNGVAGCELYMQLERNTVMPILLWLLGVPITLIVVLMLFGAF